MDFYQIKERSTKKGVIEVYPDFKVGRSKDLMVRGKSFYAIWDENTGMWSTDEYDVQRLVDVDILKYREKIIQRTDEEVQIKLMSNFSSGSWASFRKYMQNISDNAHQLDEKLTFMNTEVKKHDHVSKRLPYSLEEGGHEAYDELIGTLYTDVERTKLEWAIGAIVSGDAKTIQKFLVLYGEAGAGKSTFLNIVQKLFEGYYTAFEAKALTSSNNAFSTEVFKSNPLVAIQHDGDLSKIEDNTKLNSIISHEEMTMNEKYKPSYMARVNCFLFMATNRPVKITDAKAGIIRRLIDVRPSGKKVTTKRYQTLMTQIDFELGAIAYYCLERYRELGKNYYSTYRPLDMMMQTDVFFNFVDTNYIYFKQEVGITLSQGYEMYKVYCDEALVDFKLPRHKFREEFKNYFEKFYDMTRIDGKQVRNYYEGFLYKKFKNAPPKKEEHPNSLVMDSSESIFDTLCAECLAQYASSNDVPTMKWSDVKTKLAEINTKEVHYVKVPLNHIVIDFDIKDKKGNKSFDLNLEAATKWPPTYSEISKSGSGLHLHYIYNGDPEQLSRIYDEGIEVKVFSGKSSLRRKLTKCNTTPIMTISSGLPLKGEKMINFDTVKSEKALRDLIQRNLRKEIHPGTKPSIDFINKILEDAYASKLFYDVSDMRPNILAFANNSSNQAEYCVRLVGKMQFKSEEELKNTENYKNEELAFFDVEVFPNLFVVVWKFKGKDKQKVKMINPKPSDIEALMKLRLVGFNCRRYDNHILYGAYIGFDNEQLYNLSQKIINNSRSGLFGEAYNISYTDVYDFSSKKQSLKKFEIELGIHHQELGLPWDQPVPEELWDFVADYCGNDVDATEDTFDNRIQDFVARQILADLSGLSVNDTTQMHTAKIIFGNDKRPQDKFVYTDLSIMFPGYIFDYGKSTYRGEEVGEGGYVHAEPGMYGNVPVIDVESMHPNSLINMNVFGPYTKNFKELVDARLAIKHKDYDLAKTMLNGILTKYLTTKEEAEALSYALKIVINIVYGLTSAKFENKFKDPRNKDNIVAKRGALFMIDLKHAVQEKGFIVAHVKTDSIKIPDATQEIIDFVIDFGKKYGYKFEHEATYDKFCLVNDAVYIAKVREGKHAGEWVAVGAQFAQPYVYKTLFSKETIVFEDMCETKTVSSALYLDMNETLGEEHDYHFVGKAGSFCPIKNGCGGGLLMREKDGKYYAATGTKGYRWLETENVKKLKKEKDVDRQYYVNLVDEAIKDISKFGDFERFVAEESYQKKSSPCNADCINCTRDENECIPF
jgi:energy-coupling factor transporter ATP-binding protein EcfA2